MRDSCQEIQWTVLISPKQDIQEKASGNNIVVAAWTYIAQLVSLHAVEMIVLFACYSTIRTIPCLFSNFSRVSGQSWKRSTPKRQGEF